MSFDKVSRYADEHDVVLVGYRGVDGSVGSTARRSSPRSAALTDLLSEETSRPTPTPTGPARTGSPTTASISAATASSAGRRYGGRAHGARLQPDQSVSESAGTRTAIIYSWRYPDSIHRSMMIGVNPPGHFLWDPRTTDEQIGRYAALCAKTTAAVPAQMTSPPRCGRPTPRSRTAGSSCRSRRAMCASPHSSD